MKSRLPLALALSLLSLTPDLAVGAPGISSVIAPSSVMPQAAPTGTPSVLVIDDNGLQCQLITFEGIGNLQRIGTINGDIDISFGTSWLGLIDADAGGGGNFANEPSPSTTAFFLDQGDISIQLSKPAQIVEFQYSAAARSLPIHVIAYDANGNLIDDDTRSVVGTDYDGAACAGDPSGNFCKWDTITLSGNARTIRRIAINGTESNFFGIDNLKICQGGCAPPQGQSEKVEPIADFGRCGPLGPKTPIWGSFGRRAVLEADSGEKLELACADEAGIAAFYLYYTSPAGDRYKVGMCPFYTGCNTGTFVHSGDSDGNGKPDCLIRTRWISRDYGVNDKPNVWTGASDSPLESDVPRRTDLLDWAETLYEVNTNSLTKISKKWEYRIGPPVLACVTDLAEGDLFKERPVTNTPIDPPLGPLTEAFFAEVGARMLQVPSDIGPMMEDPTPMCDLNRDGVCDAKDREALRAHIGKCDGSLGYNPLADADGNGCLTVADEIALFGEVVTDPADVNADGKVDCTDLATIKSATFGKRSGEPGFDSRADVNKDGMVDIRDWYLVFQRVPPATWRQCR